jgi:hypothetical protein
MIKFSGRKLKIGEHEITLIENIADAKETPFGILVVLDWRARKLSQNVLLLKGDGSMKWQIEKFSHHAEARYSPYASASFSDGKLTAYNIEGFLCELDPETGQITNRIFTM